MAKTSGEVSERLMSRYTVRAWKVNLCSMTRRSRVESLRQVMTASRYVGLFWVPVRPPEPSAEANEKPASVLAVLTSVPGPPALNRGLTWIASCSLV